MIDGTLRVGLLGYGAIASEHALALRALGCSLTAVTGPSSDAAREFAATHDIARIGAVIGADDVDAVVVASPNAFHAEQAIAALRAGHHVLCEVPLAMSGSDAETLVAVERASAGRLMVCHTQRFLPSFAELHRLVTAGELDILHMVARTLVPRRVNVGWTGRPRSWIDSIVWHHASHLVDTALWLMRSDVEHVRALAGRPHPEHNQVMDVIIALRAGSGALASLVLSYNAAAPSNDFIVIATQDTYRADARALANSSTAILDTRSSDVGLNTAVHAQDHLFVRVALGESLDYPSAAAVGPVYDVLQQVHDLLHP